MVAIDISGLQRTWPRHQERKVGLVALACLLALTLSACKEELYTGLSEREANEMMALLLREGIDANRSLGADDRLTLRVDAAHFADAVELLGAHGYPRQDFASMGDVFAGDGLISSPIEERARLVYALSQELSRTVSDIDGVLSARVHVVLPETDGLRRDVTPSAASVVIRHDRNVPLATMVPNIKMLVANSIEGLVYDNVSVVLFPVSTTVPVLAEATALDLSVRPPSSDSLDTLLLYALAGLAALAVLGNAGWLWLWRNRGRETGSP